MMWARGTTESDKHPALLIIDVLNVGLPTPKSEETCSFLAI